jgi:hypothetical protein
VLFVSTDHLKGVLFDNPSAPIANVQAGPIASSVRLHFIAFFIAGKKLSLSGRQASVFLSSAVMCFTAMRPVDHTTARLSNKE